MNGVTRTGTANLTRMQDRNWTIVGTGDSNNDSKLDIFWNNTATGENRVHR